MRLLLTLAFGALAAMPAQAQTFANYRCDDGTTIPVEFFDAPRSASVQIDGKAMILPRKLFSTSGARYAGHGVSLRISRDRIALKRRGARYISCTMQ
jgi:membrane-bound inhibitor of C-type lysozyme